MDILLKIHSILRYVVLFFLIMSIVRSKTRKGDFDSNLKKPALFTLISAHIQLLIGLGLYFSSAIVKIGMSDMGAAMKDKMMRFWTVEHSLGMIIAIVLITMGYSSAKKLTTDEAKSKKIFTFYVIALVLIFASIPWPFRGEIARALF